MKRFNFVAVKNRGFTLIEVLAALVIVSLGMMAVIQAVSQTANNGVYLREKTIAHWVAMNRLTEMRLTPYDQLSVGDSSGEVEMANERWRWSATIAPTPVATMKRIDVNVASLTDDNDNNQMATISGFVGEKIAKPDAVNARWDIPPSFNAAAQTTRSTTNPTTPVPPPTPNPGTTAP